MQDGVRRSEAFVCILSEGYFESEYCCKEMRWAFEYKKPIVSTYPAGVNVGAILQKAPDDFRDRIMAIDSIKLDSSDQAYFKVGLEKINARLRTLQISPAGATRKVAPPAARAGAPPETMRALHRWHSMRGVCSVMNLPFGMRELLGDEGRLLKFFLEDCYCEKIFPAHGDAAAPELHLPPALRPFGLAGLPDTTASRVAQDASI